MPSNYQHLYAFATISRNSPPSRRASLLSPPLWPCMPYVRDIFPVPRHAAWYINNAWAPHPVSRSVIWLRRRRFKSLAPTFPHGRDHNGTYTHMRANAADGRRTRGEKARKEDTELHRVTAGAVERWWGEKRMERGRFSCGDTISSKTITLLLPATCN